MVGCQEEGGLVPIRVVDHRTGTGQKAIVGIQSCAVDFSFPWLAFRTFDVDVARARSTVAHELLGTEAAIAYVYTRQGDAVLDGLSIGIVAGDRDEDVVAWNHRQPEFAVILVVQ